MCIFEKGWKNRWSVDNFPIFNLWPLTLKLTLLFGSLILMALYGKIVWTNSRPDHQERNLPRIDVGESWIKAFSVQV